MYHTYSSLWKHVIQLLNEQRNLIELYLFVLHCFPLPTRRIGVRKLLLHCGFSAALLSQNGFFTDKEEQCAVKSCCAITG